MVAAGETEKAARYIGFGFVINKQRAFTVKFEAVADKPTHLRMECAEGDAGFGTPEARPTPFHEWPQPPTRPMVRLSLSKRFSWAGNNRALNRKNSRTRICGVQQGKIGDYRSRFPVRM